MFGDVLQGTALITSNNPSDLNDVLPLAQSVRSCVIVVEARKIKEELQKKSHSTPYRDLLRRASCTVGRNVSPVSRTSVSFVETLGKILFLLITPRTPRFTCIQLSFALYSQGTNMCRNWKSVIIATIFFFHSIPFKHRKYAHPTTLVYYEEAVYSVQRTQKA